MKRKDINNTITITFTYAEWSIICDSVKRSIYTLNDVSSVILRQSLLRKLDDKEHSMSFKALLKELEDVTQDE